MVPGLEMAVGLLIAWFARNSGRGWPRLAGVTEEAMNAVLDKAHDVIIRKLGEDSAITQLESEVAATGDAGTRTQTRVRLAIEEAAEQDKAFAAELESALRVGRSRAVRAVSPRIAGLTEIVGRENELRDLRTAFGHTRVQVLAGMGGVGKTSLARAYANLHLNDYGIVWWVRAEEPAAVDAEFRALLEVLLPFGEVAQISDARTAAFNLLAAQRDPWLLVLDNVSDAAAAHGLLPPAGDGHVLITSRDPRWPDATTIEPLGTDAAAVLLGDSDNESATALAAELGGLPLALTQAAGFVRANAISLATYLRLYRERSAELHDEGKPADYPHTVATTWQLAMDQLTAEARELLNLIAFYAPDAIPVHLLLGSWDELTRHRAVGELVAHGLVSPAGEDTITVHRLVQAVTRNRLDADEWADRAHELIIAARPSRPAPAAGVATWLALRTHLLALVAHLHPEDPDTLTTRLYLADWTGETGDAHRARELCAELLPILERVSGPDDSGTLAARYAVAHWTGQAGLHAQARDLFADLLPTLERVRGVEHPDTLLTRHHLAYVVGTAGDPARARDLHAELIPTLERVMGAEHRDTLFARRTFAHWTARSGDVTRALELFAELLPVHEHVLGAESPDTLGARHAMAHWTGFSGEAALARELFAELLLSQARVFGVEHLDTLRIRSSLAFWTGEAGDAPLARELYAELLRSQERVLGAEHPDTVLTRQRLAIWSDPPPDVVQAPRFPTLPHADWINPPTDDEGMPPGHSAN